MYLWVTVNGRVDRREVCNGRENSQDKGRKMTERRKDQSREQMVCLQSPPSTTQLCFPGPGHRAHRYNSRKRFTQPCGVDNGSGDMATLDFCTILCFNHVCFDE